MDDKTSHFIKVINIILVILMCISVLISGSYVYYHFFVKPNHETVGVNYFGFQSPTDILDIKDLSEDKIEMYKNRTLFEFSYYDNSLNNGIELFDFKLNHFTDNTLTTATCRSVGLQGYFDYSIEYDLNSYNYMEISNYLKSVDQTLYYYAFQDDITWAGFEYDDYGTNTMLNNDSKFIVSIDNTPYLIQLNGTREITEDKTILGIKVGEKKSTVNLTWSYLIMEIMHSVKTNSKGYAEGYFIFDCSDYFKDIKEYNPETKKFDKVPDVDFTKNYSYVKFNYSNNGLTKASQSLFGLVKGNANYGMEDNDVYLKDYWKANLNYVIDETTVINDTSVLEYKYMDLYAGDFISLNLSSKSIINSLQDKTVDIVIDISKINKLMNKNIKGLYIGAFQNLEINSLTIIGSGDFKILEKALIGTKINTIKHLYNLHLDFSDNATNNEFVEVVL